MLHELLLSFLGFCGGLVVEREDGFELRKGFDLLTIAEEQQVNRLVILGWYYNKLTTYVGECSLRWGSQTSFKSVNQKDVQVKYAEAYKIAMCTGIEDLLNEYTDDVAFLEQLVQEEGSMPLTLVVQHMQKYLIVIPAVYKMCVDVESKRLRGCQLLDYLASYISGMPVVSDVVRRMLYRVRAVFLRQCIAWMCHGILEDPGEEFFITSRKNDHQNRASNHFKNNQMSDQRSQKSIIHSALEILKGSDVRYNPSDESSKVTSAFDYASSYMLRLEYLPETHVTAKIASKVLFAGRAVNLLQLSDGSNGSNGCGLQGGGLDSSKTGPDGDTIMDAYSYLSRGYKSLGIGCEGNSPEDDSTEDAGDKEVGTIREGCPENAEDRVRSAITVIDEEEKDGKSKDDTLKAANGMHSLSSMAPRTPAGCTRSDDSDDQTGIEGELEDSISAYFTTCGFSREDMRRFGKRVRHILCRSQQEAALERFEALVDDIHDALSRRLWASLRDQHGFAEYMQIVRGTYLMGDGELHQALLDRVLMLTNQATPEPQLIDGVLQWQVLKETAKILSLDEDALERIMRLCVNSNNVSIGDMYLQQREFSLSGDADIDVVDASKERDAMFMRNGQSLLSHVKLCRTPQLRALLLEQSVWSRLVEKTTAEKENSKLSSNMRSNFDKTSRQKMYDSRSVSVNGHSWNNASNLQDDVETPSYSIGCIWLTEPKFVSKGFDIKMCFACDFNSAYSSLTNSHPWLRSNTGKKGPARSSLSALDDLSTLGDGSVIGSINDSEPVGVAIGGIACMLHVDTQGAQLVPVVSDTACVSTPGALVVGVTFHAKNNEETMQGVTYHARVFIQANKGSHSAFSYARTSTTSYTDALSETLGDRSQVVLAETNIEIDKADYEGKTLHSNGGLILYIDYGRQHQTSVPDLDETASSRSVLTAGTTRSRSSIVYVLRARLSQAKQHGHQEARADFQEKWDVEAEVDIGKYLRVQGQGGRSFVGAVGYGALFSDARKPYQTRTEDEDRIMYTGVLGTELTSFDFRSNDTLNTYPIASPFTAARFPEARSRLAEEVSRLKAWMSLGLKLHVPPALRVLFDADALRTYERIFSLLLKVRLVAHALERLWLVRSRLAFSRPLNHLRHAMLFFASNLLYYLQVDVVDSEFSALQKEMKSAHDFQLVMRAHRNFLAGVCRLSMIENATIQEGIDRVLHICMRFIAVCRLLHQQEEEVYAYAARAGGGLYDSSTPDDPMPPPPITLPPEELDAIHSEYFAQIAYLFQVMQKVENRGFMFRLDFNGYLSSASVGRTRAQTHQTFASSRR